MVGTDFKTVFEIQAVGHGAFAADVAVDMDLFDAGFFGDAAYFFEQPGGIALATALRYGNEVVDVQVAAADDVGFFAETANGYGVGFAFFENAQKAVALGALDFVDLFDKTVDVVEHRPQYA